MDGGSDPDSLRPTRFELATGQMFGKHDEAHDGPAPASGAAPLEAFEAAVLPALRRPPCVVSFSGGRDSSAALAVATTVARREGLEPPVAFTLRFPGAPMTEENEWQAPVVRHLKLSDWEIRELGDEIDLVGEHAAPVLRRHGVLFPYNAYMHRLWLEEARGGSLISGVGGDHLFQTWRWRQHADVLARRALPVPRDALRVPIWLIGPASVRRHRQRRREWRRARSWLRPEARRLAVEMATDDVAKAPRWWDDWVKWLIRHRALCAGRWSFGLLARDADVMLVHPFVDPGFIAAVALAGGRLGLGDRNAAMRRIFGGLLPDAALARTTKARFDEAFWGPESRAFAHRWDGSEIDGELVDPEALRAEWLAPVPNPDSIMLLQSAWVAARVRASSR